MLVWTLGGSQRPQRAEIRCLRTPKSAAGRITPRLDGTFTLWGHGARGVASSAATDRAAGRGWTIATRDVTRDDRAIRIRHKGLRALAEQNRRRQLPGDLVSKLRRVLTLLDEASNPGDLASQPGYRLHPLKGDMAGLWSIRVSGNGRVVFRLEDNEAVDVDLVDYH